MVTVAKQAQRKDRVHAGLSLVVTMYERRIPSELDRAHQTHVHVAAGYLLPMLLSVLISALTSQPSEPLPRSVVTNSAHTGTQELARTL